MRGGMSKFLISGGVAILAASAIAGLAAIFTGAAQWLGVVEPLHVALPPQTLVVGGLFLGVPLAALGWGLVWFGRWMASHS